jgi:hypothetical protein
MSLSVDSRARSPSLRRDEELLFLSSVNSLSHNLKDYET